MPKVSELKYVKLEFKIPLVIYNAMRRLKGKKTFPDFIREAINHEIRKLESNNK